MNVSAEELRQRYSLMETEELVALQRNGSLTDLALVVLNDVLQSRGGADEEKAEIAQQLEEDVLSAAENFGGWLYLVAIGIVLGPIMNVFHVKQLIEAAQKTNWNLLWQQGPMTMLSIIFEFATQGYMLVFSIFLAGIFFGKKKSFPKMFVIYVISIFLLGVVGVLIAASIPNIAPQLVGEAIAFPVYVLILGLIWISYFLRSKRVKRTFVN